MTSCDRLRFAVLPGLLGQAGGGATRSACLHATSLAERGLPVVVEGLADPGGAADLALHSCDTRAHPWTGPASAPRSPRLLARVREVLRTTDVVHLNGHYQPWLHEVAGLCLEQGVPYVVSSRATLDPSALAALPVGQVAELAAAEAEYVAGALAVHLTSRVERERAAAHLGTHPWVATIPNPVALDELRHRPDRPQARRRLGLPDGPVLLYFGRLVEQKQPAHAVEVLRHLPADHHLYLVGAGDPHAGTALLALADALGVGDRVHLAGHAHGADRGLWLAAADVLLVPSVMENFCLAMVEAVAAGLPVVAAEHVGATEYLDPGDVRTVPRDHAVWAAAVLEALAGPPVDLKRAFARIRERFRPAAVLARWEPVYAAVAPRPRPPDERMDPERVVAFARRHWAAVAPGSAGPVEVRPLTGGASARVLLRLADADDTTAVAMGQSTRQGDFLAAPFDSTQPLDWLRVRSALAAAGLTVPALLAADEPHGLLLVGDLGPGRLDLELRARPDEATALLDGVLDVIIDLQAATTALDPGALPRSRHLDQATLVWEMFHHVEWAVQARHGTIVGAEDRLALLDGFDRIAAELTDAEQVLVHRDLNATNLVPTGDGWGLVDFDDAAMGPLVYDLCSLLLDVNLGLARHDIEAHFARFHARRLARLPATPPADRFHRLVDLQAVQRTLKIAGRFVWLDRIGGTFRYLHHVDTALAHLAHHLHRQPDLAPLARTLTRLDPTIPYPC